VFSRFAIYANVVGRTRAIGKSKQPPHSECVIAPSVGLGFSFPFIPVSSAHTDMCAIAQRAHIKRRKTHA